MQVLTTCQISSLPLLDEDYFLVVGLDLEVLVFVVEQVVVLPVAPVAFLRLEAAAAVVFVLVVGHFFE